MQICYNSDMKVGNRTLFFGDNLDLLNELPDGFFDLIYLDPPYNSNRNYNVLFKQGLVDSTAQIHAFLDTWEWTPATLSLFNQLKNSENPSIAILMSSLYELIKDTPMMAYLVNMTARLIPMRKVLKDTGSIYLHCDPSASHYLKLLMDTIFGSENFRNEIIWHYSGWNAKLKSSFNSRHDVILFYTKSNNPTFNSFSTPWESEEEYIKIRKQKINTDEKGKKYVLSDAGGGKRVKRYLAEAMEYGKPVDDVWDIDKINNSSKESLNYPTQKPEELLERIVGTSTNEGDWVLDPFCGCGTTVAVAERLKRNWVGIDISMQAIDVINQRMKAHYPYIAITIDGIPQDLESAATLSEKDKIAFQDWAITLIHGHPPSGETKRGADRGVDGLILFRDREDLANPRLKKIIIQVKGGGTGRGDIAKLKGDIERESAPMGVFITLKEPTPEMKKEAVLAGEYKYSASTSFPRIQILSIKDWFEGKTALLPTDVVNPFKTAETKADQQVLI